jgi:hypothetical protein
MSREGLRHEADVRAARAAEPCALQITRRAVRAVHISTPLSLMMGAENPKQIQTGIDRMDRIKKRKRTLSHQSQM